MSDKNCTLSKESLARLFCNLDELVEFQRRFLIDLEALLYGPMDSRLIGKHFVESVITPFLIRLIILMLVALESRIWKFCAEQEVYYLL